MTARDLSAEVAYLTRALKAPTLRDSVDRLADRAVAESWSHLEFLVACLQREVSAREAHGGEGRIRAARFPARKSLEEFDFDHARGLKRDLIAHLGTLDFVAAKENVVFLGPPAGPGQHAQVHEHQDDDTASRTRRLPIPAGRHDWQVGAEFRPRQLVPAPGMPRRLRLRPDQRRPRARLMTSKKPAYAALSWNTRRA